jgi:outer membrane lipoprotein SlyB
LAGAQTKNLGRAKLSNRYPASLLIAPLHRFCRFAAFARGVDMYTTARTFSRNPLVLVAAAAVIILAGLGIALAAGWIPNSMGQTGTLGGNASATGTLSSPDQASTQQPAANAPAEPQGSSQQLAQTAPPPANAGAPLQAYCANCGTVESVREYSVRHHPSGVGLVAGALVGGLIGHQFFRGTGNVVSTVGGAAGGAYVGNKMEENHHAGVRYSVKVRLEDGSTHVVRYAEVPPFRTGDRIRYDHGHLDAA